MPPDDAFDLWLEADLYPRWQQAVRRVTDVSGPLDEPGTRYVLDHGPRMKFDVTVLESQRPKRHRIVQRGMRATIDVVATFQPSGWGGTRLTVQVEVPMDAVSAFVARLMAPITDRQVRKELERFAALAEARLTEAPRHGTTS